SESPLSIGDDPHTKAEALLVCDERHFVGFVASALWRQAVARKLLAIAVDADIGVGGSLLFGFGESDFAQRNQFRVWLTGIGGGCAEQPVCQQDRGAGSGRT